MTPKTLNRYNSKCPEVKTFLNLDLSVHLVQVQVHLLVYDGVLWPAGEYYSCEKLLKSSGLTNKFVSTVFVYSLFYTYIFVPTTRSPFQ
jgi:hypothetical protein